MRWLNILPYKCEAVLSVIVNIFRYKNVETNKIVSEFFDHLVYTQLCFNLSIPEYTIGQWCVPHGLKSC